jgi:hypothetical protein
VPLCDGTRCSDKASNVTLWSWRELSGIKAG